MVWIGLAALLLSVQAASGQPDPVTGDAPAALVDEITAQAVAAARAGASRARLPDGTLLPAATEEDRQLFAIPAALERQIVRRGMLTGQLEFCRARGVARSFVPYMQRLRASGLYSAPQLAYVGFLHGVSQGLTMGAMEGARSDACTDALLARLSAAAETETVGTP
jgi:hypothetical protein